MAKIESMILCSQQCLYSGNEDQGFEVTLSKPKEAKASDPPGNTVCVPDRIGGSAHSVQPCVDKDWKGIDEACKQEVGKVHWQILHQIVVGSLGTVEPPKCSFIFQEDVRELLFAWWPVHLVRILVWEIDPGILPFNQRVHHHEGASVVQNDQRHVNPAKVVTGKNIDLCVIHASVAVKVNKPCWPLIDDGAHDNELQKSNCHRILFRELGLEAKALLIALIRNLVVSIWHVSRDLGSRKKP
mmetsp:Transcript_34653/g.51729  ORF Transcript_34653/g.51729 Transcript_34653/m.51729 type:complete len:242 (+) Transcript_34653:3-728(+)